MNKGLTKVFETFGNSSNRTYGVKISRFYKKKNH